MPTKHVYLVVEISDEGFPRIDKAFADEEKAHDRQFELVEKDKDAMVHVGCIELVE